MEKNPAEDSAFQRLQQSGLLGLAGASTSTSPSLPAAPTDELEVEQDPGAGKVDGLQPVSQEDAQILVEAQSLLAKSADGNCSFVIIQMDENGDGKEQSYAVKVETNEEGQALMAEADVTQALLALPSGGVQFDTGNSEVTEVNSRYARLVEATSSKPQPFEILQSAAQAIADGMVFDLEPSDTAEREPQNATEGRLAQDGNLDGREMLVLADPFEKETIHAAQFRVMTQIKDINAFLLAVRKCTDPACGCRQYHCPICPKDVYRPAVLSKLKRHIYAHWKIRIDYRGVGIVRCYRSCHPNESHFHCPECPRLFTKRNTFILHLNTKHGAGVVDARAAENEKHVVTRQEPKRKTPKVFHMVMAVIGPETLDYLGTHVTSVLEECRSSTGVSYNMSEHNFCVLKGDMEAIKDSYAIIDEFMDNILKNPDYYDHSSLGLTAAAVTVSESLEGTEKPAFVGGKISGEECAERGDDAKLTCENLAEIVKREENLPVDIPSQGGETSDIPKQDPMLVGQNKYVNLPVDDTNIEPILGPSVEQFPNPGIDPVPSDELLISDKGVKCIEELCEKVEAVPVTPDKAEASVGEGEGKDTEQPQPTGTADCSSSQTVGHPQPDAPSCSEKIDCVISVIEASSMSDHENVLKSSLVPSAVESERDSNVGAVTPKKLGREPKTNSPATVNETTAEDCSKISGQTKVTQSCTRNLRRKRSTYRDYQSRMDALVKPWTKKTSGDEDGNVSENDMVIKEEVTDEEFGMRSRKRDFEDATYQPNAKLAKFDLGGKDGDTVMKRKRGRPRKTPLKSNVVEFLPGADESRRAEDSRKAEVVSDEKVPVLTAEGDVPRSVQRQRCGDVGSVETECVFDAQTPVEDPVIAGEDSSVVPVNTVPESDHPNEPSKAADSSTSALAAALLGKKMTESSIPTKGNKVNKEEKSSVELDVIKDDETGDIKLSLSVSFPKPNVKPIRRVNRRQLIKGKKRYECEVCDLVFQRCGQLTRHRLVGHGLTRAPRPKAVCDICGKEMRRKHLKAHIAAVHKSEKPWECDICQKSFSTHSYLKYHMSTHKDAEERARPHLCSICGRGFYKVSQLQDHQNAHTGSRPYKCRICDKTFQYHSAIGKHMSVHSQNKPFECHICHKTFKSKDYLRNHQITHEPQSHPCPTCKRVYSYRHSLLMHCRRCPGTEGNQEEELNLEMPVNQCYMCGYCQEIFYDLETVQEHLTQHVQQEATTAEELMQSLVSAEPVTEEQAAAIKLESEIIHNDAGVIEDGLVPQSTVIVQDSLGNESTVYVQEDGTPVLIQGEAIYGDGSQGEGVLVSDQDQMALHESNIPLTVTAEVKTSEGTILEVPVILQGSQA